MIKYLTDVTDKLDIDKALCIGTPTVFEALRGNKLFMDIDSRYLGECWDSILFMLI